MAEYKYASILTHSENAAYDDVWHPASATPYSGIYRCTGCGREAISTRGHPLPPQNHHQHTNAIPILWQLIVASQHA